MNKPRDESEASDDALHSFWSLSEDEILSLEGLAGHKDPGANETWQENEP